MKLHRRKLGGSHRHAFVSRSGSGLGNGACLSILMCT